jgi:hypothetical protein
MSARLIKSRFPANTTLSDIINPYFALSIFKKLKISIDEKIFVLLGTLADSCHN